MALRLVAAVILWCGVVACGFRSTLVLWRMAHEVNRQLPKEQQFATIGWYPDKAQRLYSEYERLYPGGGHRKQLRLLFILGLALLVGGVIVLQPLLMG